MSCQYDNNMETNKSGGFISLALVAVIVSTTIVASGVTYGFIKYQSVLSENKELATQLDENINPLDEEIDEVDIEVENNETVATTSLSAGDEVDVTDEQLEQVAGVISSGQVSETQTEAVNRQELERLRIEQETAEARRLAEQLLHEEQARNDEEERRLQEQQQKKEEEIRAKELQQQQEAREALEEQQRRENQELQRKKEQAEAIVADMREIRQQCDDQQFEYQRQINDLEDEYYNFVETTRSQPVSQNVINGRINQKYTETIEATDRIQTASIRLQNDCEQQLSSLQRELELVARQ